MHLGGGVSDQKRTVGRVSQLLVHLLPENTQTSKRVKKPVFVFTDILVQCVLMWKLNFTEAAEMFFSV